MGDGDALRLVVLVLVAVALPALASAEPCDADGAAYAGPGVAVSAGAGESCPEPGTRGDFVEATIIAAGARVELTWESWDTPYGRERSLSLSAPPRFVSWHDDAHGCSMAINVAGTTHLPCAAGAPPPPPALP